MSFPEATLFTHSMHLSGLLTFASYGRGEGREHVVTVERSTGGGAFLCDCARHGLGASIFIAQPTGKFNRTLTPADIASSFHVAVHLRGGFHTAQAGLADLPATTILLVAGDDVFAVWRLREALTGAPLFSLGESLASRSGGRMTFFVPLPGTMRNRARVQERHFLKHLVYTVKELEATKASVKPLTRADQIPVTPKDWLWPGMIAARKAMVLMGPPGVGKSTIAMDIAARVTTGRNWPDGTPNTTIGDVAFIEAEDDQEEDSRPRAEAAGADMTRLHIVDEARNLSIPSGIRDLERELDQMNNPRLIVLSPYRSYFGGKDNKETNNEVEIRRRLKPIMDLAKERRCAVLMIGHKKPGSSGRSAEDAAGPQAYGKALRAMMTAAEDKTDPLYATNPKHARRILFSAKSNNGGDGFELVYRTVSVTLPSGEISSRIEWLGQRETGRTPLMIASPASAKAAAMEWLRSYLAKGPREGVPVAEVEAAAIASGHSRATLHRARAAMGVDNTGAVWRLT